MSVTGVPRASRTTHGLDPLSDESWQFACSHSDAPSHPQVWEGMLHSIIMSIVSVYRETTIKQDLLRKETQKEEDVSLLYVLGMSGAMFVVLCIATVRRRTRQRSGA